MNDRWNIEPCVLDQEFLDALQNTAFSLGLFISPARVISPMPLFRTFSAFSGEKFPFSSMMSAFCFRKTSVCVAFSRYQGGLLHGRSGRRARNLTKKFLVGLVLELRYLLAFDFGVLVSAHGVERHGEAIMSISLSWVNAYRFL